MAFCEHKRFKSPGEIYVIVKTSEPPSFSGRMRSFQTLESEMHPRLEFPVSICHEARSSCCSNCDCSVLVDLDGEAIKQSGSRPIEEEEEEEDQTESTNEEGSHEPTSSVCLVCSGPNMTPLNQSAWAGFIKNIRYVHVPDNVEDVGDGCFRGCWRLSSVGFGENSSVTRMGVEAFVCCGLTEIRIPKTVQEICKRCFCACRSLRVVVFSECASLKRIGEEAFSGCPLTEIYIPDSVEELADSCLHECTQLSRINFGPRSSLKVLGRSAFDGVYLGQACALTEIRIPDAVEIIGEDCFYSCIELCHVIFGEHSSLKRIGPGAFTGDSEVGCPLRRIQIPDSVEVLGGGCFEGCKDLQYVEFGKASSLKKIGPSAFAMCALKEIHIPDAVTKLGRGCFEMCSELERVTFGESSSLKCIQSACFRRSGLVEFAIPKSLELCKGDVFAGCPLSKGVTCVGNPILSIQDSLLFSSLNGLTICCPVVAALSEVVVPANVEYIGKGCFMGQKSISRVTFGTPSTLKRLGKSAFRGCGIGKLLIPSSVVEIGDDCFLGCEELVSVTFGEPSELKRIGRNAFSECHHLRSIHIPDSVEELSDGCFCGCKALCSVTFGKSSSLRRIGAKVFSGGNSGACPISEIDIPDSVEEIDSDCFMRCRHLVRVGFGEASALKRVHCHAFNKGQWELVSLPPAAATFGNPKAWDSPFDAW